MANISVSIHTFNIEETLRGKNKYKIKKRLNNNINHDSGDIFNIIKSFCIRYGQYEDNENNLSVFRVSEESCTEEIDEVSSKKFRHMILKVESGEYGFTTDLVDPKKKSVEYRKPANLAEMKPFFLSVIVDKSEKVEKGFIIFQNVGIYSVKTVFKTYFSDFLKSYNTQELQYEFNLGVVTPKQFATQLLKQYSVKQVKLISYSNPMDPAEKLNTDFLYQEEIRIYRKFALIQKTVEKVCKYIDKKCDITDIIEIDGFEYDDIKIELDIGKGKVRTLDLGNIDNMVMKLNFKDFDVKGVDGHADRNKLKKEVEEIYKTYSKNINLIYTE